MKLNLQLFGEAVQGKRLVYLFRPLSKEASSSAVAMAFTTENERTKSVDFESTETKDGSILTPGAMEHEVTATAILAKGDTMAEDLEDACDNKSLMEIWEANLDAPGTTEGTFKGRYMQGYLTEFSLTSSAEEHVEYSTTFAVNGAGAKGDVTVTAEQQTVAAYAFKDTNAAGV